MSDVVIVSLISFLGTSIGAIAGVMASNKLTNHRLTALEEKVDKHNNLVERMVVVEQRSKSNQHRLENMGHTA